MVIVESTPQLFLYFVHDLPRLLDRALSVPLRLSTRNRRRKAPRRLMQWPAQSYGRRPAHRPRGVHGLLDQVFLACGSSLGGTSAFSALHFHAANISQNRNSLLSAQSDFISSKRFVGHRYVRHLPHEQIAQMLVTERGVGLLVHPFKDRLNTLGANGAARVEKQRQKRLLPAPV